MTVRASSGAFVELAEAILLVGGQGSRLRPLTLTTPKPMLPCAGVPFLTHQLLRLAGVGVKHVVLATSYRSEVFAEYYGDGGTLGLAHRLRHRGRAAGHRRRDPQRRRPAHRGAGRAGDRAQR